MSDDFKDVNQPDPVNGKNKKRTFQIPGAIIFWAILLAVFVFLYFFQGADKNQSVEWDQATFEHRMQDITQAVVMPEEEGTMMICSFAI